MTPARQSHNDLICAVTLVPRRRTILMQNGGSMCRTFTRAATFRGRWRSPARLAARSVRDPIEAGDAT
jgi:hypothetical protein